MSLLTIVKNVANEVGFAEPSTVIGSNEETAIQMLALANRGGKVLARRKPAFRVLIKEHTFTTVADQANYALPSDFGYIINNTVWDRANYWRMRGQLSPGQWQFLKSGIVNAGIRERWRMRPVSNARQFYIEPTPDTADETKVYEYVSNEWCQKDDGTGQTAWVADTDTGIIEEDLLELDLRWRFLSAKGLNYAEEKMEFETERAEYLATDLSMPDLSLSGDDVVRDFPILDPNLPDTGIGDP